LTDLLLEPYFLYDRDYAVVECSGAVVVVVVVARRNLEVLDAPKMDTQRQEFGLERNSTA
jgi:hypothetical protein